MAADQEHPTPTSGTVRRRTLLQGLVAGGVVAGGMALTAGPAQATGVRVAGATVRPPTRAAAPARDDWAGFDRSVQSAFDQLRMAGAAVAVVSRDAVLHTATFGHAQLAGRRRVTPDTHFLVASTTKSMSSLLVATYVDEGRLSWDQPVVDAWSGFRAPTEEMTRTLRVRDLLGMASGLAEPPAVSTFHEGDPTPDQLLQATVNLPVIADAPDEKYFYNNTVYALGGYLPFLAAGVAARDLPAAYVAAMRDRVYGPVGMASARIADDPRGLVDDYAVGYGLDLRGRRARLPYGPVGSYAPVGGTLATIGDMAAYLRLQLRGGESAGGTRVVSTANLDECHRPHVDVPIAAEYDPDALTQGYALGWITETYRDGTTLTWHTGGIDGFTTYIGFLPGQDLGLAVLSNTNVTPNGAWFYTYVLNLLLNRRLGLNAGVTDKALAAGAAGIEANAAVYRSSAPVDARATAPWLGHYEAGYRIERCGRELTVYNGPRRFPLRALPDGTYVAAEGFITGAPAKLERDADGTPTFGFVDIETARRTTGLVR